MNQTTEEKKEYFTLFRLRFAPNVFKANNSDGWKLDTASYLIKINEEGAKRLRTDKKSQLLIPKIDSNGNKSFKYVDYHFGKSYNQIQSYEINVNYSSSLEKYVLNIVGEYSNTEIQTIGNVNIHEKINLNYSSDTNIYSNKDVIYYGSIDYNRSNLPVIKVESVFEQEIDIFDRNVFTHKMLRALFNDKFKYELSYDSRFTFAKETIVITKEQSNINQNIINMIDYDFENCNFTDYFIDDIEEEE